MQLFRHYHDLVLEIDILEEQLENIERELTQWWIGGRLFKTVSIDTAALKVDKLKEKQAILSEVLEMKTHERERFERKIKRFKGLEYKVFYARYIEGKPLKEIAEELEYSYQYIKEISRKIRFKDLVR